MEQTTNLQKKINERAEKKLYADLISMWETFNKIPLLFEANSRDKFPKLYLKTEPKEGTFGNYKEYDISLFRSTRNSYNSSEADLSEFAQKLKDYWLPIYIERETIYFIEQVDKLRSDVDDLFEQKQDF